MTSKKESKPTNGHQTENAAQKPAKRQRKGTPMADEQGTETETAAQNAISSAQKNEPGNQGNPPEDRSMLSMTQRAMVAVEIRNRDGEVYGYHVIELPDMGQPGNAGVELVSNHSSTEGADKIAASGFRENQPKRKRNETPEGLTTLAANRGFRHLYVHAKDHWLYTNNPENGHAAMVLDYESIVRTQSEIDHENMETESPSPEKRLARRALMEAEPQRLKLLDLLEEVADVAEEAEEKSILPLHAREYERIAAQARKLRNTAAKMGTG